MKVFIDVGGHIGQTLEAVIDPIYAFDKIYCFEPAKICYQKILEIKDPRIEAFNCGLLDVEKKIYLNFPGSEAASIFSDHSAYNSAIYTERFEKQELCDFISASDFFIKNITANDYVVMKLNCEGSECAIIKSLLKNNQYKKLSNLLIDFDIVKIPTLASLKDEIINLINNENKIYHFPEDVQYGAGSHFGGIKQWLNITKERDKKITSILKSLIWDFKNILDKKHLNYYKFQVLKILPKYVVQMYYNKVKSA